MVDIKYLRSQGISAGDYKKIFTAEPAAYPQRIRRLVNILRTRTDDGYRMCLNNWKGFAAIDIACDASFQQTTPTLVRHILSKNLNANDTITMLGQWGLNQSELFKKQTLENGQEAEVLDPPIFYKVLVPLVSAYLIGREARLFNERVPDFLKFKPLKQTAVQRIFCEVWSGIIESTSRDLGYPATFRQAIHQTLKYGPMLAFPREQWFCETQMFDEGSGATRKTVKEGIRYVLPHPSKFFYDINHPLTSINTDSGTEFAGHWDVLRYGDILDDRKYWNRSKIFCGNNWMRFPGTGSYFTEFYPCTLSFPIPEFSGHDRTMKSAWYNVRGDRDKAVFLTQHFMKLVPRDWGLGQYTKGRLTKTYNHHVWHRFTLAGADTIIYAEPYAYNPMWFMGYDYDFNAARNDSLALQLIPWQDHLGNILTNMLYQAYRNLMNLTFYNNQVVDPKDIEKLQMSGFKQFAGGNFVGFNPLKWSVGRNDAEKVFHNVAFPQQTIQEMLSMVNLLLNILERVQQFSAQETGGQASHQQSVEEIKATGGATSHRVNFTGGFIDEGVDAWKLQLVHGTMAYRDPDFSVNVSANIPDVMRHLKELGFEIDDQDEEKITISGHKRLLKLEQFAASNEGAAPDQSKQVAQAIFQAVTMIAQQEELRRRVGVKNLARMIEAATIIGGGPPDFKIQLEDGGSEAVAPNVIQAIQQAQQATIQEIQQRQVAPAAEHVHQVEQQVQALQQTLAQLQGILGKLDKGQNKEALQAQEQQQKMQHREIEFQAEQKRKDAAAQADIQRKAVSAHADTQISAATAQAEAMSQPPPAPTPQPGENKVSETMNYKDLPEEQKKQVELQAGLVPTATRTYLEKKPKPVSKS